MPPDPTAPLPGQSSKPTPGSFVAWDEIAAYVDGAESRARAITLARDECWQLADNYRRSDLRVRRVFMQPIAGEDALEFFDGEFEHGWIEVNHRPLNAAQRAGLTPMWKVEPRG